MSETGSQRCIIARLIDEYEQIISSGKLPEAQEQRLRGFIVDTCNAFQMDTIAERPLHDAERSVA